MSGVSRHGLKSVEILLVEDSPTDRLLTLKALEGSRVSNVVHAVEDGVQALQFLRREGPYRNAPRPDLVLLDLNMPRMDGREVLSEIKRDLALRAIPVVVLTTSSDEEDIASAYSSYANSYITKPIEFEKLRRALDGLGEYWVDVVTLPTPSIPLPRARSSASPRGAAAERFLLVEDSESDAFLARTALNAAFPGTELVRVTTLANAEATLAEREFDVILTDLGLPDAVGVETVRRVIAASGGAAVLVLSGTDDEDLALASVQRGAQDYLVKSEVGPRSLARAVRYALDRRKAQGAALHSQRMEALGQIAGGVAHDFNNVLTVIQAAATTEGDSVSELREALDEIRAAATRGAGLSRHLLAFARRQVVESAPVSLNEVVGDAVSMLRRVLAQTAVVLQLGRPVRVMADRALLDQVVMNLALNARDAMAGGGRLTFGTSVTRLDVQAAQALHPAAFPGEFAVLRVEDTGTGMPPEVLARVFEPFFSTKEPGKGTGLGLSTVVGIVEQHRGWIVVRSEVGVGTRFDVYWPAEPHRVGVATEGPTTEAATAPVTRRTPMRVLVVDDEHAIRAAARRILERRKFVVEEAPSALDALAVWEARGPFDLLVTDVRMGEAMGGAELAERLRASAPWLPVLLCSGYSDEAADRTLEVANTRFLPKPYGTTELLQAVDALLAESMRGG